MARCEATTQSGEQCKLEAQEGSRFCHVHAAGEVPEEETGSESEVCWDDLAYLALAGVVVAGMFFFVRAFGKWIPRI